MKKLSFKLGMLLFLSSTLCMNAQEMVKRHMYDVLSKIDTQKNIDDNTKGSPYLSKAFKRGRILYDGKATSKIYLLRYNANKDYIEVYNGADNIDKVLENPSISCSINNEKYYYLPYYKKNSDEIKKGYLKEIYRNKNIVLYKKEVKSYVPARNSVDPLVPSHPAKYSLFTYSYIKNLSSDTPATYIKNKKALKRFLKKEYITLPKEEVKKIRKLM